MQSYSLGSEWSHNHRRIEDMSSEGYQISTRRVMQRRRSGCQLFRMAKESVARETWTYATQMVVENQAEPPGSHFQSDRIGHRSVLIAQGSHWEGYRSRWYRIGHDSSHQWSHKNITESQGRPKNSRLHQRHQQTSRILPDVRYSRLRMISADSWLPFF